MPRRSWLRLIALPHFHFGLGGPFALLLVSILGAVGRIRAGETALLAAAGPDLLPRLQGKLEVCHVFVGAETVFLAQ